MSRVLVTGATRGIGRGIAEFLAAEGHDVVGVGRGDVEDFPGRLLRADLADDASVDALLTELEAIGSFDGLVNNAALNVPESLLKVTREHWEAVMELDVWRPLQLAQALVPGMKQCGYGRIVNIASRGMRGVPGYTSYGAAKSGLDAMTRVWALELARHGITVNTVAPGPVDTDMFWSVNPPELPRTEQYLRSLPMGRIGQPAEIAAAVAFFLSPGASYITGQTLFACGGVSVG
jgi:3-oxoacyl-[acyl-carrier protein] reductase